MFLARTTSYRLPQATRRHVFAALLALLAVLSPSAGADRIRDIASIQGVRTNQLIGYGLIVGLDGTGDQTTQTPYTVQAMATMLQQLGINLPPGSNPQPKNVAAVIVTAQLPSFAQPGQQIDVTVSSIGNSKSLRGGTLLLTALKGADGATYAMAQGNLSGVGVGAGGGGNKTTINHLSAGRIPAGATVERAVPTSLGEGPYITLELNDTSFGGAAQVSEAINKAFAQPIALAQDGRSVRVRAPDTMDARVAFLAQVQEVTVDMGMPAAKVIVNVRTGSVVMNRAVTLEACAVTHANLTITITTDDFVSQPAPFSYGTTEKTTQTDISIKQDQVTKLAMVPGATRLADVVKALNTLGASPADLAMILQTMKAAGSLKADLEII